MAVVTGDLYKGFTFGGISSKEYGVYITQEASFDAPEKDVETFEIAGRNGAYILDNGRFRNISVSYKCGIAESTETDFATAIRRFRNALSALAGKYVRLTDDYNTDEYREAAFFGGFSVEKEDRRAGEFTVTFDAKPQRFLTSGEDEIEVQQPTSVNVTLSQGYWASEDGSATSSDAWVKTNKIAIEPNSIVTARSSYVTRWLGFAWYKSDGTYIKSTGEPNVHEINDIAKAPSDAYYVGISFASPSGSISPSQVTDLKVRIYEESQMIDNPTPFDAEPLFMVWGYGDISINGETISIDDTIVGDFIILAATPSRLVAWVDLNIPAGKIAALNAGDEITTTVTIEAQYTVRNSSYASSVINSAAATVASGTSATASSQIVEAGKTCVTTITVPISLSYGEASNTQVYVYTSLSGIAYGIGSFSDSWYERVTVTYDGGASIRVSDANGASSVTGTSSAGASIGVDEVRGYSTKSVLGEPLYFDMNIGEAYKEEDGAIVSVNSAVSFPAELPTLKSGVNAITYDNTITQLKVVPRWWEV